jgi:hypothetical protein
MTQDEIRAIVRQAVRDTLIELGVDTSDNQAMLAMQQDFAFLRKQRLMAELIGRQTRIALIGALIAGLLAALWAGVKWNLRP